MLIEIVEVLPLVLDKARRRTVPVVAARAPVTVVKALVPLFVTTILVIVPEHAPVASVQVREQDCRVILSGATVVTTCEI